MRVLAVDDEKPCLDELVYLLKKQENLEVVGAFTNPAEARAATKGLRPDVAFLDLVMPHLGGVELAREMLALVPGLKIVFVTAYAKELSALKNNPACGSLLKPVSEMKLQELLRRLSVLK